MKKFLLIILIMFLLASCTEAKTLKVLSLKSFSTEFPSPTFEVQTIQREIVTQDIILEQGSIISGIVLRVEPPKRGKRDSYFEFIPTEITYRRIKQKIEHPIIVAKVLGYEPIDPKELTFTVARKVANFFLKGAISAVEFADGAIKAENGQRIKSGAIRVYNNSFFSYIEPGEELNINRGDIIILKIKTIL